MPPEGKRCCVFAGGQLPPVVPLHLGTPTPPRHWQCADDIPICYLCGAPKPNRWNRDHVPPRQFFPKSLLKTGEVDALEWLPTHHECNSAYQLDEEYFVVALGIMARTMAGHALMHDVLDRLEKGQQTALVKKVEAEFIDKTTKRIERHRVNRVATKMVRGLHFLRTGSFVPASTQF